MHMLSFITCKVRSENGVWIFEAWSENGYGKWIGSGFGFGDLEMRAAHPNQNFQGVPPPSGRPGQKGLKITVNHPTLGHFKFNATKNK